MRSLVLPPHYKSSGTYFRWLSLTSINIWISRVSRDDGRNIFTNAPALDKICFGTALGRVPDADAVNVSLAVAPDEKRNNCQSIYEAPVRVSRLDQHLRLKTYRMLIGAGLLPSLSQFQGIA